MLASGRLALALIVGAAAACNRPTPTAVGPDAWLTHGPVVGEVTDTSARLWGRCAGPATLQVALEPADTASKVVAAQVTADRDFTATIALDRLRPATRYQYLAWCGTRRDRTVHGVFQTAPPPTDAAPVRFAFGADLGGQNVCRDRERGYPILDTIAARHPDFFVALGDMIYADNRCLELGRLGNTQVPGPDVARDLGGFWAHWRYNRDDPAMQRLLARTVYYAAWDDHEVADDAGPRNPPTADLLPLGRQAFLDHQPIRGPLYRRFRWGRHLELFVLDTRSDRDPNAAPDGPDGTKSMLGTAQRGWLEAGLAASDATWKMIASTVPLAVPTGATARDGWADAGGPTGFERELRTVLASAARHGVVNLLWLTGDVHHAAVYRYRPFPDEPRFVTHELIASPLNAGLFPSLALDDTLAPERLFFLGPPPGTIPSFDAALSWFNFGQVEIGASGAVQAAIVDATGRTRYRLELAPTGPR